MTNIQGVLNNGAEKVTPCFKHRNYIGTCSEPLKKETLQQIYGRKVAVRRNSGDYEHDWEIQGDAYTLGDGNWWLNVEHPEKGLVKEVSLKLFTEWN